MRRYTSLPALLDLLWSGQLTLLSPEKWEDRNDAYFMRVFQERSNAKAVLALCFSEANERFHLWKVFTQGTESVCIEFRHNRLIKEIDEVAGLTHGAVEYKLIRDVAVERPPLERLPFLKRIPYTDEKEYRILYTDMVTECDFFRINISIACIQRVTLSQWMSVPVYDAVKKTIQAISGCGELTVVRSSLLENEKWKEAAKDVSQTSGRRRVKKTAQ